MPLLDLTEQQVDLILSILIEKRDDLDVIIKNPEGLNDETINDTLLDHRDINNIIREIQFYAIKKP